MTALVRFMVSHENTRLPQVTDQRSDHKLAPLTFLLKQAVTSGADQTSPQTGKRPKASSSNRAFRQGELG